ncbi:DUF4374 domain-containing protein [Aquimarina sp. W85]|uniref:DUF4374 domain-containing protein n=1 Tax=Aquimarina rhodophyticola TaxID=3342246 RepID=UPI00366DD73D
MNTLNYITRTICLAIVSLCVFSCSSDDDVSEPTEPTQPGSSQNSKYVVGFQALPVGQGAPVDYIVALPSLESLTTGEISVEGEGIPLKGWRFFHQANNTVFTAGYSDDDKSIAFQLDENGAINEVANFTFQNTLDNFSAIDDKTLLAVELSYGGLSDKRFHFINAETGKLEKIISHPIDIDPGDGTAANPGSIPWVTGMILRDGKLFVSYHKWAADGSYVTPDVDRAYVAIFSYPEFELENIIYDDRTSPIGVNGHSTGIIKTETNDIFSYSSSALTAGFTAATKPSGILKISNGSETFDVDYFFDVENTTNGGKLFWMDYVGNGKAIGRIILDDTLPAWGVFKEQGSFFKLVILDLVNKTITDVKGVPAHANRYTAPLFVEDGKAYLSSRVGEAIGENGENANNGETHVYVVDPETATATKGAKVNGLALKGIFKLTN